MIDIKSRNEMIKLLDNGNLDELKEYIIKEETKHYIDVAKKQVPKYFASNSIYEVPFYGFDGDKLLLSNGGKSVYLLNEKSILSNYYLRKIKNMPLEEMASLKSRIDFCNQMFINLDGMESLETDGVLHKLDNDPCKGYIDDLSGNNSVLCNVKNFEFSKVLLGDDASYSLVKYPMRDISDNYTAIFGKSIHGKCLIMGFRRAK